MAKSITYFDREHTGGINLAAMEDTQLKENLVQDVAAGGEEAPTATAVKEAVDAKMDKADIVNDLTTGGTDKALSAEQGKVLEDKKVDKLTEANDLVYVHGSDGTEQGKALSEFVVDTDIVNDITTGGTDKVLSAEQGKVLEGKKVDKLTDANDMVYVHGSDGTEQGKALSEFVVDTDIVNDRTTGGVDKVLAAEVGKDTCFIFNIDVPLKSAGGKTAATVNSANLTDMALSPANVYIHPDEIPEDVKQKIRKSDLVVFSSFFWGFARFSRLGLASDTKVNSTTNAVINTSLPDTGNWEGWYMFDMLNYGTDRVRTTAKTNVYVTYLFDGDETLETLPNLNGPMPNHGFSYSVVYIKPSDIKANRYTTGIPADYIKQVDGSMLKPGDILIIRTSPTAEATKKIREIYCIISHTAVATNKQLGINTHNESLPAAGNWGGWLVGLVFTTGWDREALLSKTDSTKMQSYFVLLPNDGKTIESMPDLNTFNSDKGVMHSNFFVHPADINDISGTLKKGDIVNFLGKNLPDGKVFGAMSAVYAGYINDGSIPNDDVTINVTDPDGGNFNGWHAFAMLSSAYGRVQMSNKVTNHIAEKVISVENTPETAATLAGCDVTHNSNKAINYVYIKPEELGITDYKTGDNLLVDISADLAGEQVTIGGWLEGRISSGSAFFDNNMLNTKLPASGNWDGFCRLTVTSILTNAAVVNAKSRTWTIQVKSTDTQFLDTWTASKTGNIEDKVCPLFNFMLTKDMMSKIPNAKVGDSLYVYIPKAASGFSSDIHLYGKLFSREAIPATTASYFYSAQDNSGDISGCGTMRVTSSNTLPEIVRRKPNFFAMTTTIAGSNIPAGLKSLETIAFAPSDDTASFAHALKEGDIIEVRNISDVMYTLMFIRYATSADNVNNKNMIVGQLTEPADMTGYLWCRIIASRSDTDNTIIYRTNKYQPSQFEIGKSYRMRITVTESTDQLDLYGLGIDPVSLEEYSGVLRRGFKIGDMFNLLLENGTKSVILLVTLGFNNIDDSIHALCIANGDNRITNDLG